jgi:hypothetical protein
VGLLLPALLVALAWSAGGPPAGKAGEKKVAPELAWVAPDAAVVVRLRVADLWNSEGFKILAAVFPMGLEKMDRELFKELKPQDVESVTVVLPSLEGFGGGKARGESRKMAPGEKVIPEPAGPEPLVILTVTKPAALAELRQQVEAGARAHKFKGQTYYTEPSNPGGALHFRGDRTMIGGGLKAVQRGLDRAAQPAATDPYGKALTEALRKHQLVVGLKVTKETAGEIFREFKMDDRMMRRLLRPLEGMKGMLLTLDLGKDTRAALRLFLPDKERAERALPAVQDLMVVLRLGLTGELLAKAEDDALDAPTGPLAEKAEFTLLCLEGLEQMMRKARVEVKGTEVAVSLQARPDFAALKAQARAQAGKRQADPKAVEARNRKISNNNLKQMALALHNFHDTYKRLPPPAICDKQGKPLLSWRVAILPFNEEGALYREFRLDEPWDSEHNKKLLEKMPKIYAPVGVKTNQPYLTFYQAIVGPGAAWELKPRPGALFNADGLRIFDFRDGTSNTIALVEAVKAVPWTKPDDVPFDPKGPLPKLGGLFKDGFHAAFMDGSVRFLSRRVSEATLRAIITRAAGDILGNDLDD